MRVRTCRHSLQQQVHTRGAATVHDGSGCASPGSATSPGKKRYIEARTTYEGAADDVQAMLKKFTGFCRANFIGAQRSEIDGAFERVKSVDERYEIGAKLGEGATATVYRATSKRTGMAVALKVISKELVPDQTMLQNEIEIHKATDHPNIIRLLRAFEDDKSMYLATEVCEGGDLRQHLETFGDEYGILKMTEEEALQLFMQIVAGVRYLHKMGIVHRDLKLGNFLCTIRRSSEKSQGRTLVKLTDFGVSASCGIKHLLTRRVGTDGYMAPEVLRCQPYNEKADIFSIGCILHALLTGAPPKQKEDGTYSVNKMRLRYVSEEMRALIDWLTQAKPEDRPSIEDVAQTPLIVSSQRRLRESTAGNCVQVLDQMYRYASFPLLKKAALVAMVSRAESDVDFLPCIERFMSFGSHHSMNYAISATDIHQALLEELSREMDTSVRLALHSEKSSRMRVRSRTPARGLPGKIFGRRFKQELRAEVDQLVQKIDCDGDGSISYSEWLAATVDARWYRDPTRISATFQRFDHDQDGMISEDDLLHVIPDLFTGVAVKEMLQESQLSARPHSWLSEEDFSLLMRSGSASTFTLQRMAKGGSGPLSAKT